MISFDEDKQKQKVAELLRKEEEEVMQALSQKFGLEYIDLSNTSIDGDALRLIDEQTSRDNKIAAFDLVDRKLKIAVRNPEDEQVKVIVKNLESKGYTPTLYLASTTSLERAQKGYKELSYTFETKAGSLEISNQEIVEVIKKVRALPDVIVLIKEVLALKKSARISRILEIVVAGALATDASDVHIEPEESYVRLRYRLDGVLIDVITFDIETYLLLLSRIKLLSGLKLNIKKDAQDGRFSVKIEAADIEIRTSILPGAYNESIVLRILNPKAIAVPMEELGIQKKLLGILEHEIRKPNGMILTTGPTGSGKTTTLYAFLKKIHSPDIKIITIEDPIEYHLPGIVQTQTNEKGYTFLEGLRSALRQDPDVIMVGEIRDSETAGIAINSSLTGHLVFSTLHTNSAAGAFPRLIDLGVNSKIITSAINITLAQRLVRKLCAACKKEKSPTPEEQQKVASILGTIHDRSEVPTSIQLWEAAGCDACNHTGYKGRIGIYEAILKDKAVEEVIEMNPSDRELAKAAIPQGIYTMRQDGIIKVLNGVTSLPELGRVIDLENEV
ncbi:MAG TPA: type II/IV secretion system protein [Candidatus Paceibacterota bacterium]